MSRRHFPLVLLVCACTARDPVEVPPAVQDVEQGPASGEPAANDDPAPSQIDAPDEVAPSPARHCVFTTRVPRLDEMTTLGARPAEMLSWLAGEHQEALAWQGDNGEFSTPPEGSVLSISVDPIPGAMRLHVSNPEDPSAGFCEEAGTFGDISTTFDQLELDVRLRVSTSDGGLNESLETTLVANASDFASGWVQLPLAALGDIPADATAAYLRFGISPFGNVGELYFWKGDVRYADRYATPAPQSVVARFPTETFCGPTFVPFRVGDNIRGASMQAAVERLNTLGPVKLGDVDGSLSWTFATTGAQGCAELSHPRRSGGLFSFLAHVTVVSSDQQIDGNFDVGINVAAYAGIMGEPSAETSIELSDPTTAAAAARDFGVQAPLDFSPYQKGLLAFRTELQGDLSRGELSAMGVNPVGGTPLYSVGWSVTRR